MKHAVSRVVGAAAAAAAAVLIGTASPAAAAQDDLGWIRLQPATGKSDVAVIALTQSACPSGDAVVATLRGPNIAPDSDLGNLVGVTEYSALDPTLSGQLWVPLSFNFRQWFAVNGVTMVPGKAYTITVVCRDLLRGSQTFGGFSGQVVFDGKGGYRALADAAKPFNTELKPDDPTGVVIPTPSASGKPGSSASSPAAPQDEPSGTSSAASEPGASDEPDPTTAPADPAAQDDQAAAAPSTPAPPSGGSGTFLLASLGALAAVGGGWALLSRRRAEAAPVHRPRHAADTR